MKTKVHSLLTLGAAALLAATSIATHAQTPPWQTLYDGPGQVYSALIDPFTTHPQPSLFFGGLPYNGCSVQWVGPLDTAGTPPIAICSDVEPGFTSNDLGYDSWSGRLYSAGNGTLGWQVRESADQGGSWTAVDVPFAAAGGSWVSASGFATDGQGRVFVCGSANGHWIVRQRNSIGVWSTIRDWSAPGKAYYAQKMHIASGYLFVVGEAGGNWAVQRLNLANNTWDTSYTGAPKGKKAGAVAMTSHGSDLYVLAWADGILEAPKQCVLLKGASLGTGPWTTIKTFAESIQYNRPRDLAFDHDGNLYVVGHSTFLTDRGTWNETWIVRRLDALTGIWQPAWTPLGYPGIQRSFARQVSVDATGNVFITGMTISVPDPTNRRVIVQKWMP